MTAELTRKLRGYAEEWTARAVRLAHGDTQASYDNLTQTMSVDPMLREAVQQAGAKRLVELAVKQWPAKQGGEAAGEGAP